MNLIPQNLYDVLRANSEARQKAEIESEGEQTPDFKPVVMLTLKRPNNPCIWLFTEIDEDGYLFGLCDLGLGFPELGDTHLSEILELKAEGYPIELIADFKPEMTLSQFAEIARIERRIIVK